MTQFFLGSMHTKDTQGRMHAHKHLPHTCPCSQGGSLLSKDEQQNTWKELQFVLSWTANVIFTLNHSHVACNNGLVPLISLFLYMSPLKCLWTASSCICYYSTSFLLYKHFFFRQRNCIRMHLQSSVTERCKPLRLLVEGSTVSLLTAL